MNAPGNLTLADFAQQRIAVAMVGAVRTLVSESVHVSIRKNLLDAQLVPTDLYLDMSLDGLKRSDASLQRALHVLRPCWTHLHAKSSCESPLLKDHRVCKTQTVDTKAQQGFFQYAWLVHTLQQVDRREHESGIKYTWVIRTRPDVAFFDRVDPCIFRNSRRLIVAAKESNPAYFDGFWMSPRWLSRVIADGMETFSSSTV